MDESALDDLDDDAFGLEPEHDNAQPPTPAKTGRRAFKTSTTELQQETVEDRDSPPKFGRRKNGDKSKNSWNTSNDTTETNPVPPSSSKDNIPTTKKNKWVDDVVTDIAMIPDLGDETEQDITAQVAKAPVVRTAAIQSLKELDKGASKFQYGTTSEGVDLGLLASVLLRPERVIERDEAWEIDSLLSKVAFELQNENEPEAEAATT